MSRLVRLFSVLLLCVLSMVQSKPTETAHANTNQESSSLTSKTLNTEESKDPLSRQLFGDDIPTTRPLTGNYLAPYIGFPHPNSRTKGKKLNYEAKKNNENSMWNNSYKFEYTGGDGARIYEYPTSYSHYKAPRPRSSLSPLTSSSTTYSSYVKEKAPLPEVVKVVQNVQVPQHQYHYQQFQPQPQQQQQYQQKFHYQLQSQQQQQQFQQQQQRSQQQQQQQFQQQQQRSQQQQQQPNDRNHNVGSEEELLRLDFVTEPKFRIHHNPLQQAYQQIKEESLAKTMPFLRQFMQGMFSRFSPNHNNNNLSRKGQEGIPGPSSPSQFPKLQPSHYSKSPSPPHHHQHQNQNHHQQPQPQQQHGKKNVNSDNNNNSKGRPIGLKLVVAYKPQS